jgi:acyl carrier protein
MSEDLTMTRDEILAKLQEVLADVLAVDEDEVVPDAVLTADLGAESIDFLDIVFRLEQEFGFKIAEGELFPQNVAQDPEYVQEGLVTPKGLEMLRERLRHADLSDFEKDPQIAKMGEVFTVDTLINFIEQKLGQG